jgi:phage tail-like protein
VDDASGPTYRYLNRANRWLGFAWKGLRLGPDGALRLASLPRAGEPPPELVTLPAPEAPAGIAVVPGGDVYLTDPATHRLLVIDGCDATMRAVACLAGPGDGPDELRTPRGLLHHPSRNALLVADSGNHRIQLLALPTLQLTETWGRPGELDDPRSLARDPTGNVYAVDHGNRRVLKFDTIGRPDPAFWQAVRAHHGDLAPAEVAVGEQGGGPVVLILDDAGRIHAVDPDGRGSGRWDTHLERPMGLATSGAAVYLGDNAQRGLFVFQPDGSPVGGAHGYQGPVAAIVPDPPGGLLVHAGGQRAPVRLTVAGAYRRRGVLWGGPVRNPTADRQPWHLLRATVAPLDAGAGLQLYVATQVEDEAPPVRPDDDDPFADERWRRLEIAANATETIFPGQPLDQVWVGALLSGEGLTTPVLSQLRLDFAHQSLLRYLPALYGRDESSRRLLVRWLTLFESGFDGVHREVEGLAALFDPAAAPARYLRWLAGWIACELPEAWDEARKRRAIAEAFAGDARRGTVAGLRAALRAEAGLEAVIEEPINQTGWWALPGAEPADAEAALSVLGVSTVLAVAAPQGAVVGTSGVLDGSFLSPQEAYATPLFADVANQFTSPQEAYATPLFADVANQFTVRLYRGHTYSDQAVTTARALLDREAPAHTSHHLCVVQPRLRVGLQARLGVDAVVAGPPAPTPLDGPAAAGIVLGGEPAGRLGDDSYLGRTHLTDLPMDP